MVTLKLRNQLILAIIPVLILPMLVLGIGYYLIERNERIHSIEDQLQETMDNYQLQFNNEVERLDKDLDLLSNSQLLRQYYLIPDSDTRFYMMFRSVLELFKGFQISSRQYREIALLNDQGKEEIRLSDPGVPNKSEDESQQPWFATLQQDRARTLTTPVLHEDFATTMILAAKSIPLSSFSDWNARTDVKYHGYLTISMSLDSLFQTLDKQVIGVQGFLLIVNSRGEILHAPQQATAVLQKLGDPAIVLQQPRSKVSWIESSHNTLMINSRPLFADFYLVGVWPREEINLLARDIFFQLGALLLMLIGAVILALFWLVHQLVEKPIYKLKTLSSQLSQVNDEVLIEQHLDFSSFTRRDEIGDLASTFRTMADHLRSTHQKLHQNAYFDTLTGLYNRQMFNNMLRKAIALAERQRHRLAVLFIDIDEFKEVNDTLGHDHGDEVLKLVAQRLNFSVRDSDYIGMREDDDSESAQFSIARFGGDEFTLVLSEIHHPLDAKLVAERIVESLARPFTMQGMTFHLSASIGIAVFPDDGTESTALMKNADIAMYQAKSQGKNQFEYFDPGMTQQAFQRHQAMNELRRAIEEGSLRLQYQPQVCAKSGAVIGCEALVRWQHPVRGMVPPIEFIPLAEESGLIVEIGRWVLHEACRQNREWQTMGLLPVRVGVNFSTVQFNREANIAELICKTLQECDLAACYLDVEITETGIMQSRHIGKDRLQAIKNTGVTISMDDFGTGYSSLASLRDFPLDKLKVDKSFVDAIVASDGGRAIMNAILAMARELNLQVVAEGVETEAQLDYLRLHGCDFIQGYFISRPLTASDMTQFLQAQRKDNLHHQHN